MGAILPASPVGELMVPDARLATLGFRDWIQLADAVSEEARQSGRLVNVTYVERSRFAVIRWRTPRPLGGPQMRDAKLVAKIRDREKARDAALRAGAKVLADARANDGATSSDRLPR